MMSAEFIFYARLGDSMYFLHYCIEKYLSEGMNSFGVEMASDAVKYAARAMFHEAINHYDRQIRAWDGILSTANQK